MKRISSTFRYVKKATIVICFILIVLLCTSCKEPEDKILKSLGKYEKHVIFFEGDFQDYTDYAKYYYSTADIDTNNYFTKIQDYDTDKINEHLDDFEGWIETIKGNNESAEIVVNYDFDRTIIDVEDYIYINSETQTWDDGHTSFVKYDIYFFDIQTLVLYYFHNNI